MSVKVIYNSLRTQTVNDTSSALTLNQLSTGDVLTLQRNSVTLWKMDKNGKVTHDGEYALTGVENVYNLAVPTITSVTYTGTAGVTTYGYKIVATVGGYDGIASAETQVTLAHATLTAARYNTIVWPRVTGATGYKVYKTTGGTTGLIATITDRETVSYVDTGDVGGGETPSSTNKTGRVAIVSAIADSVGTGLVTYKARGTVAAPTVITTGDILGFWQGYGYAGATNGYVASSKVELYSAGTIADTSTGRIPGGVKLYYATDASPSVVTLGATLDQTGLFTLAGGLTVSGTTTSLVNLVTSGIASIGGAVDARYQVLLQGTPSYVSAVTNDGLNVSTNIASVANASVGFLTVTPTWTRPGSGTTPLVASASFSAPSVAGGATTTTEMSTVYIASAPTNGTANYALHSAAGNILFTGATINLTGARITQSYHTNITSTNAVTVDSSIRSKINSSIQPYDSDVEGMIDRMSIVSYQHRYDVDPTGVRKLGVIAETIDEPLAISDIDDPAGGRYPGVNTMALTAMLLRDNQRMHKEIHHLKQQLGV